MAGLLEQVGLDADRVMMANMSAAMGAQFAEAVKKMTEKVRELGPNPLQDESKTKKADVDSDHLRSAASAESDEARKRT